MKRETYLEIMRGQLEMPSASEKEMEVEAIARMTADGMTVQTDQMRDHRFRVRVFGGDMPQQTTTSTSGYPVLAAFEKWQAWKAKQS